jgi:hypothetical protein
MKYIAVYYFHPFTDKLIGVWLVKKFSALYGTRRSIAVFATAHI